MGCNCKKIERVSKKNPLLFKHEYQKKGWCKIYENIKMGGIKYIGILLTIVLFLLFLPFLVISVIYNGFVKGETYLNVPFINKKIKTEDNG